MKPKLLLALQFSPVDGFDAVKLAELIADIQGPMRDDVEAAAIFRRDTNPHTANAVSDQLERAFRKVWRIKSKGFATGWPHGCNDLWQHGMMELYGMSLNEKHPRTEVPAVLTFEADCVPLRPDWIERLIEEWERCQEAEKQVIGHVHTFERQTQPNHINGNAIFDIGIFGHPQGKELMGSNATSGWDAYHGKLLLQLGMDTPMIAQKYRIEKITREELEAIRKQGHVPALFHGLKHSCGIPHVRAMMADGTFSDPKRLEFDPDWADRELVKICGEIASAFVPPIEYSATSDAL